MECKTLRICSPSIQGLIKIARAVVSVPELFDRKFIVASGARHEQTGKYYPLPSLTWEKPDGSRGIQLIQRVTEQFATSEEARKRAVEVAKFWIECEKA